MRRFLFSLGVLCFSTTVLGADIATQKMVLRGVDKITGRVKTMQASINKPLTFGTLTIIPETCLTKPQEEMPENAVFLRVFETLKDNEKKEIFKGWMFSSNPALSAMEHPIYDIWLLNCIQTEGMTEVVSQDVVIPEEDLSLIADEDNPSLASEDEMEQPAQMPAAQ